MSEFKNYVKLPPKIRAKKMEQDFVIDIDSKECRGIEGDYIMIDGEGKQCVCECAVFEGAHEEVTY